MAAKKQTRKRGNKKGGAATPLAPKKQKRQNQYNLQPSSTVRQLINIFEPIQPLNIQEGMYNTQHNNAIQPQFTNIQQQLQHIKKQHTHKNTVTQREASRPQKQQAIVSLAEQKKVKTILPSPSIFAQKLKSLTPTKNNKHRYNIWTTENLNKD